MIVRLYRMKKKRREGKKKRRQIDEACSFFTSTKGNERTIHYIKWSIRKKREVV